MKIKYNYYDVVIPGDYADTLKDLAYMAITAAKERTRIYYCPAIWIAKHISGEIGDWTVRFQVCRRHR